jgi:excisionase family DNA binding protein
MTNGLPNKKYVNVKEVAEFWGKSERTIYRWVEKGVLVGVKKGGSLFIPRESAEKCDEVLE